MRHSIRWRIALPYIGLVLLVMAGLTFYLLSFVRQTYLNDLEAQLTAESRLLADRLALPLSDSTPQADFDSVARYYADLLGLRVTIIGVDGTVRGESHENRLLMDNHLYRQEIQQALDKGQGTSIRFSNTAGYEMMYAAAAIRSEGKLIGFARVALPLQQIDHNLARLRIALLSATVVATLLATLLAVLIAGRTTQPIRHLTSVAKTLADGDLSARLFLNNYDEIAQLALTFNQMAEQLQTKLKALAGERDRLTTILDHMADGVLITDADGRIHMLNPAAIRILELEEPTPGLSLAQTVRDYQIIDLWKQCQECDEEQVATIEAIFAPHFLRVVISPLHTADLQGYLVILQDLTQVRRLETVRRDFISNLSHELLTPLASLKALAETLRDSALDDPQMARHFLDRMETEVDALTQMVQELLELSRIESGKVPLRLKQLSVAEVVQPPVERLRPQAERAGLTLAVTLPEPVPEVLADAERIQQVITNLVHNAIKFTPTGGTVTVTAAQSGDEVLITVTDTGVGIPADDLPRIFERFYKIDRARSAGGGTGLGLSIARHIVQAHGGQIWATSTEGQGSTFYFTLPLAPAE